MDPEDLAERLLKAAVGALDLYSIYLGDRLGLYRSLAVEGGGTPGELASRTGLHPRYLREWLEQQAATGLLDVDDASLGPEARRYRVPEGHVAVLADPESVLFDAHKGIDIVRAARPLPALVEAFRTGDGLPSLPWEPEGRGEFNRAIFLNLLGHEWLPAIPEVDERLRSAPPARVADIGCGTGWAAIAVARAYPGVLVDGFDLEEAPVALATVNAQTEGLADRVRFHVIDAATLADRGPFDLAMILEALHDMSRPVQALAAARGMLAPGGSVLVVDEGVGDAFTAPADLHERYAYGWSVVSCLPGAMGDPETAATGAVMRPTTVRRYAERAGFAELQVLPIEDPQWNFYRLVP